MTCMLHKHILNYAIVKAELASDSLLTSPFSFQVGQDLSIEDAYNSARLCGLNIIAQAKVRKCSHTLHWPDVMRCFGTKIQKRDMLTRIGLDDCAMQAACDGDLNKVKRIVKLVGFVNAPPDFQDHPKVFSNEMT